MSKLYLPSGYLDFQYIRDLGYPFTFIVGGRGTGKTYGALKFLNENEIPFMFLRRTQTQCDLINKPEFSPWKKYCADTDSHIGTKSLSRYNAGFYYQEKNDEGAWECVGAPIGYTGALSTISNMRGFDASDVEIIIYDEFIPERHEKPLKNECAALMNAYETVNRNRELDGERPVQLICLANANDLANPVFLNLGLVRTAEKLREKGVELWTNKERGICLVLLQESPISDRKKDTALYRLTGTGSEFARMSLSNEFSGEDRGRIKSCPLGEYRPVVGVGELTIYKHKSRREYYCSPHRLGSPPVFTAGDTDLARFARAYSWLWREYMANNIIFEEYLCQVLLTKYFS